VLPSAHLFGVRASWQLHGPLIHVVTPTDQADLRTWGPWGQETEQAGDLGLRPRRSGLRGPWVGFPSCLLPTPWSVLEAAVQHFKSPLLSE